MPYKFQTPGALALASSHVRMAQKAIIILNTSLNSNTAYGNELNNFCVMTFMKHIHIYAFHSSICVRYVCVCVYIFIAEEYL